MKRVHIISVGDPLMSRLAVALKKRGYEVHGSGINFNEPEKALLEKENLLPAQEGWFEENLSHPLDWVAVAPGVSLTNPELRKAKDSGLLILSFTDVINRIAKNKIRVVIGGSKSQHRILSIVLYALRKQNLLCDFVALSDVTAQKNWMELSYDARMVLIEGKDRVMSKDETTLKQLAYTPHILVIPNLHWTESADYPTLESYLAMIEEQLKGIERDGKFIFNLGVEALAVLGEQVREDITAIPYSEHETTERDGQLFLSTRYGEFPVRIPDTDFLSDLNAARLTCRQFGLKDADFYIAVSEYSAL